MKPHLNEMPYAGQKVKIRCPQCKQQNFTTSEVFEEVVFITIENGIVPNNADDHVPGGVLGITCFCNNCEKRWKPRGIKQFTDILIKD